MENKEIKREDVIKRVNDNDYDWFYELYNDYCWNSADDQVSVIYDMNYGDGNEYVIALEFKNYKFIVQLEGTYSSWDSPYWDSVSFAKAYEFKETRYKSLTKEELRDSMIDSILDDEES